jgi:AcrR family transcriptional regulator
MRQSILSAAREIAAEEGWQAVTTRKVAERIEYS